MTVSNAELLAEVKELRRELKVARSYGRSHHTWLKHFIRDLEYNPDVQVKVHLWAAYFWVLNFIIVLIAQFVFSEQWASVAVLYVAIVSLYANFATDYGAVSAALAAKHGDPLPEIPMEPHG